MGELYELSFDILKIRECLNHIYIIGISLLQNLQLSLSVYSRIFLINFKMRLLDTPKFFKINF